MAVSFAIAAAISLAASAEGQVRKTIQVTIDGRVHTGWPLVSDGNQFVLLRRDGSIKKLEVAKAKNYQTIANDFQPYSFDKCVERLSQIYGSQYSVTKTSHFVIVHPRGKQSQWAQMFEGVYTQFYYYFTAMGFKVQQPEFPMIAIVFNTREEYDQYTVRRGMAPRKNVVGFYMPANNRMVTYNQQFSGQSYSTIVHEITHQVAFNTGVQSRYAQPPIWVCEGLAVMFEAPGVRDRQRYPKLEQRLHAAHFQNFKVIAENGVLKKTLRSIAIGDDAFNSDPKNAYTTSWALMYYLSNTKPTEMSTYLRTLAQRKNFSGYPAKKRWADFVAHFGSDIDLIEARMKQYFGNLK